MRKAMEFSENFDRQLVEGVKIFKDNDSVLFLPDKEKGAFSVIAESKQYDTAINLAKKYATLVTQWEEEG
jgi:uncharacterized protein YbcC (UPF0753/DUF2309 family)